MPRPRRSRLRRHLLAIVVVKIAVLVAAGQWLRTQRPAPLDGAAVAEHLTGAGPSTKDRP